MINRTFRLFISSTFSDFITERNILNDEILPEINEFCQSEGYNFQLIDLRWGINNESALNQNTLAICLDEVKRCRLLSPRPNFLLMAGEKYGWLPLPASIKKKEFDGLISFASNEERNLICTWYILDENEIGGEYFLKKRVGQFIDDGTWSIEEHRLHNALIKCVQNNNALSEDTLKKLNSSATEQEIIEGLLLNDELCDNAIVVFRKGYPEKDEDQTKIDALKSRVFEKMLSDSCNNNLFELSWGENYSVRFKEIIIKALKDNISKEIKRLNSENSKNDSKKNLLCKFISTNVIIERESELDAISNYVNGEINSPLFVIGDSGSGKTTILADYIIHTDNSVFFTFYGFDENSYLLIDCLKTIVNEINQKYGISYNIDMNTTNITESMYEVIYAIPSEEKVIIIIDGLDMYHDIEDIHESVLPNHLPPNVKIIVSTTSGEVSERFISCRSHVLTIDKFTKEESIANLSLFFKQRNRQIISDNQKNEIIGTINNGATPLLLKLITEICINWRSTDTNNKLPDSIDDVALLYLTNMFNKFGHNKELVLYSIALIANSPYGITEDELQLLLLRFSSVKQYFISEDRYNHNLKKLPFAIWSRLFYDLKGCLTLTKMNGYIVVKFTHNIFYRAFTQNYTTYCQVADSVLLDYYTSLKSVYDTSLPNIRKALILPFLLKKSGKIKELSCLYNDLDFVNMTILIGHVNNVISDLQFLIGCDISLSDKNRLISLFNCLQENRSMLNCYYSEFFSCAANSNIINQPGYPIERAHSENYLTHTFFPYSYNSKVEWHSADSKYAVYHRSYVYICDSATGTELCRIFVEPNQNGKKSLIQKVIWISISIIAVVVCEDGIYLYDVGDIIPNPIGKIKNDSINPNHVKYTKSHHLLFMQEGKMLIAFNPDNCEQVYHIPLRQKAALGFDIFEDELYIKEKIGKIDIYNVCTGTLLRNLSVKVNLSYVDLLFNVFKRLNPFSIYRINENIWLERVYAHPSLIMYDLSSHKKAYIHPPFYESEGDLILGRKILLIVKSNVIVAIYFDENLLMKYFKLSNIKSASWIIENFVLSVLTINGLYIINIDDFIPFPAELSHCLVLNKSIFYFLRLTGKRIFNTISYFTPWLKAFSNYERFYNYDILFSDLLTSFEVPMSFDNYIQIGTIVEISDDGKRAIAFEDKNSIIVYDAEDRPIVIIDRLNLAVNNNILKLCFSLDSRLLLLWCNHYIKVFEVERGTEIISIYLSKRPALDVWIDCSSKILHVILCDQNEYTISLEHIQSDLKKLPKCILDYIDLENNIQFWGPYTIYPTENGTFVHHLLNINNFAHDVNDNTIALTPYRWFTHSNMYYTSENWLYYCDGEFYLNGNTDIPFKHPFIDFSKSQLIEQLHDASPFRCYIREKNDLQSNLYEYGNRYLVLVSRMMNSIIAFDMKMMIVKAAYKVNGNIIGCRVVDEISIEILIDKAPYQIQFKINLYND